MEDDDNDPHRYLHHCSPILLLTIIFSNNPPSLLFAYILPLIDLKCEAPSPPRSTL